MGLAEDVVFLFAAAGLGVVGSTLLIGPRPVVDPTLTTINVIPTPGAGPVGTHNLVNVPAYVRPSAQIVCRAPTYALADAKIQQAYAVVYPVRNRFVNGTWYVHILVNQEPFPIGEDENLVRFVFNISSEKRLSSATS